MATKVQLAAFEEVKKMITDLVEELKIKMKDEVKKRDYCLASFDTNEKDTTAAKYLAEDLSGKVTKLENMITELIATIDATKKEISELQIQIAIATNTRAEEN